MLNMTRTEAEVAQRKLDQIHDLVRDLSAVTSDQSAERVNSLNISLRRDGSAYITQRVTRSVYIRAPRFDQINES